MASLHFIRLVVAMVAVARTTVSGVDMEIISYIVYLSNTTQYTSAFNSVKNLTNMTDTQIKDQLGSTVIIAECAAWQCNSQYPTKASTECFQYSMHIPCHQEHCNPYESTQQDWHAWGYMHKGSCNCGESNNSRITDRVKWMFYREGLPLCGNETIPPYNATAHEERKNSSGPEQPDVIKLSTYKKSIFINLCSSRECNPVSKLTVGSTTHKRENFHGVIIEWLDESCLCMEKDVKRNLGEYQLNLTLCNGETKNVYLNNVEHILDEELLNCREILQTNRPTHPTKMGQEVNGMTEQSSTTTQIHTHTNTTSQTHTHTNTTQTSTTPSTQGTYRNMMDMFKEPSGSQRLLPLTTTFTIFMCVILSAYVT